MASRLHCRPTNLNRNQRADLRKGTIGFVFQFFALIPTLTAYENVEMPLLLNGKSAAERKERAMELLKGVDMTDRAHHRPDQLSGGQQQRVAIARALAGSPRFLLADEPTGNLDSVMARQVMELLEEINGRGTTVIMVTHDPELARRAHRNVHMLDGQVTDFTDFEAAVRVRETRAAAGA